MVANMWKNSLKNVEYDNNKILYETLLGFFLQRNGTYRLNKPRISYLCITQYSPNYPTFIYPTQPYKIQHSSTGKAPPPQKKLTFKNQTPTTVMVS